MVSPSQRRHAAQGVVAAGNCHDNAHAEAFFSTLKIELVYRHDFHDHDHARQVVFDWIEAFHNLRRRHSSIGHLSPVDFENLKTHPLRTQSTFRG